jgi:hypothetical protein
MDVGRLVPAEEEAGREGSEWERREREEERRAEAEELGARGGGATAAPAHGFLYGVRGGVGDGHAFIGSFLCSSLWCASYFLGIDLAEGKGSLQRAAVARTSGREPDKMYAAIVLIG